jgi:hypothetical protein
VQPHISGYFEIDDSVYQMLAARREGKNISECAPKGRWTVSQAHSGRQAKAPGMGGWSLATMGSKTLFDCFERDCRRGVVFSLIKELCNDDRESQQDY